jgi:DNA repair photolyase
MPADDIQSLKGKTNPHILLIAPHGRKEDDTNTGELVRQIQKILDCPAIINETFRKPDEEKDEKPDYEKRILDLYKVKQAKMHPSFIKNIETAIKYPESTFVFWIHGIKDKNIKKEAAAQNRKDSLDCLIGVGQGNPKRPTCNSAAVVKLIAEFNAEGIKSAATRDEAPGYRGWDTERMNQYFRDNSNGFKNVQSVQLEFGFEDVRNNGSIEKTANNFARALFSLNGVLKIIPVEDKPNDKLVADSLAELSRFFNGGYHTAIQEAGDFIIERFYGREPERVLEKKPVLKESLFSLITKLQEGGDKVPSKSWFYNARDLAAHEQIFKKRGFQIFGNLGHSHKLALLPVRDLGKIEALAKEATKRALNVAQLKHRIKDEKDSSRISLDTVPTKAELAKLDQRALAQLRKKAETKVEHHQEKRAHFQKCLEKINGVFEKARPAGGEKNDKKPVRDESTESHSTTATKRAFGFQEWAGKTYNICTGCENDCLYCWAKERAYRFKQVERSKWKKPTLRRHDVDRKHRPYGVRVAFPSTHDIFPSNIEAYLSVLGNLLAAGNEVLIVSKPRVECIRAICEAAKDFKEKILFRFTIGAMDDDILSFWEPNAPRFLERAESLRYAYKHGFRTSISTEPMLQSYAIEAMANKLLPQVNDAMWIGKMNYLGRLKKNADETLAKRIAEIEQGQTDEMIWAIYNSLKNNPKIKWKDSIKKVVGLEGTRKSGIKQKQINKRR